MSALDVFTRALEICDPDLRSRFVITECAEDSELRERVLALLKNAEIDDSFMEPAAGRELFNSQHEPEVLTETAEFAVAQCGNMVGPYKLLQKLGEGGMGTVYMAEQKEPVRRRVALKIVKSGMDSDSVLARFDAERHALGLMDHPNIARVLDAGTTASGKPYFVMELVKGVPIQEYCDAHKLTPRERLSLFAAVCNAVQHAHTKGIVHRDLKPSNILVAEYDDHAVPKVIDFGVAKALHQPLTENTLFTQFGQIIGTLEYMSPEQAKINELDVDTRSDIYSLGVLLYELLTGTTPHERQRLRCAAWDEIVRILRDEEPIRPSKRISTSATLPAIAATRRTSPSRLTSLVAGDLDWIVMKALEKDRNRRYQSCTSFLEDIDRFLKNQPVLACPPSKMYLFKKFLRRNTALVCGATAVVLTLCIGLATTTWFMLAAQRAQAKMLQARALTLSQTHHTQLNYTQTKNLMRQRELLDEQLGRGCRRIVVTLCRLPDSHPESGRIRDEVLAALLQYWEHALQDASLALPDGHSASLPGEFRGLVSDARRKEFVRAQRCEILARLGRYREAFDEVVELQRNAREESDFFLEHARTCALSSQAAFGKGDAERGQRYATYGKKILNATIIDNLQQLTTMRKLMQRDVAKDSDLPVMDWLHEAVGDPELEVLGLQAELHQLQTEWERLADEFKRDQAPSIIGAKS